MSERRQSGRIKGWAPVALAAAFWAARPATASAEPKAVPMLIAGTKAKPNPSFLTTSGVPEGTPQASDDKGAAVRSAGLFSLQYVANLRRPVAYDAVAFNYKARADASAAPWKKSAAISRDSFAVQLAWDRPLTDSLSIGVNFAFGLSDDVASDALYDQGVPKSQVESTTTGYSRALGFVVAQKLFGGDRFGLFPIVGLGIFDSEVTMNATLSDATQGKDFKIAAYSSYFYALLGKLGLESRYRMVSGLTLTADALIDVPLKALTAGDSGFVDFSAGDFGPADYHLKSVRSAMDQRTNGYGLSFALGVGWQF